MKKTVLLLVLIAVLSTLLGGVAFAATPQDIYDDYADNGFLNGTYTDEELQAYLDDATLQQYPPNAATKRALDSLVRGRLASRDEFPFTGTEIGWVALGLVALLTIALGLHRAMRSTDR